MGNKLLKQLDRYFFRKTYWHNLGLIRLSLGIVALYHYTGLPMQRLGQYEILSELHAAPIICNILPIPFPLSIDQFEIFSLVFWVLGVCATLGIFTRITLCLFGIQVLYLMGAQASMGWFDHETSISSQVFLILAFAPGSNSFSLDKFFAFIIGDKDKKSIFAALLGPKVPVWGVKLILILLAGVYFTAGVSKIRYSGIEWMDGKTLGFYLSGEASIHKEDNIQRFIGSNEIEEEKKWKDGFGIEAHHYMNPQYKKFQREVGESISKIPFMMILLSIFTILIEFLAPLILIGGWFRIVLLLSFILMHNGIYFLMNIPFKEYQTLCFLLLDWPLIFISFKKINWLKENSILYKLSESSKM